MSSFIRLVWVVLVSIPISTMALASTGHNTFRDIAYGAHKKQKLDVYFPQFAKDAPVIFFVHGGAWRIGDKGARSQVKSKIDKWVKEGFVFISVNYRMLPETPPLVQAQDVRDALIFAQNYASKWGGSRHKFVLMGHSAGGHLISLVSVKPELITQRGATLWLGTVSLDTAAYDIVKIMSADRVNRFYKKAFGESQKTWKLASPLLQLQSSIPPFLAVCSSTRKQDSCQQAEVFAEKVNLLGGYAKVLPVELSHRKLNVKLGEDSPYTQQVHTFIMQLLSAHLSLQSDEQP
ncbi:alpha/beta hydrolase [Vibrio penaeicida]|uniref:BD-FAE-like domain-containing protein n=1 Tax=Vibrio penaeicida TaxID=104609 RepID=A0AAV5NYJ8_9VIBR|nr:alpha/beta hydrolase [Vibrio penaeicida]RTZ18810.1 alpha/beta hydrolase [Vibrio penaeicida]GLQ75402.1 hypothetical protein GCM10007932_47640 [Vibrio penaeicida]